MDINFSPVFSLDLIEFDERLPSMKFKLDCKVEYLGSCIEYRNENLWIECDIWDKWLTQITELKLEKIDNAVLHDMDQDFLVTLTKKSADKFEFEFFHKIREYKKPITEIRIISTLSLDCVNRLISSSEDFPVMW